MARPSKLTPQLQAEICRLIAEDGLFRGAAASLVDVDEATVSRWYTRGAREEKGPYRAFHLAVAKAEATFQQTATTMLKASSARNPKILQWILSRRFPHQYGRRDNVELVNADDQAADAQQLRELLMARLTKLAPEDPPKPDAGGAEGEGA